MWGAKDITRCLDDFRLVANSSRSFDFDDPSSMNDTDYLTITGLNKDNFNHLLKYLSTMRNSCTRSIRVALAIYLTKLRQGISNSVLATMFRLGHERAVAHILQQVRQTLINNFTSLYLGFNHISREEILARHQTAIANTLLTSKDSIESMKTLGFQTAMPDFLNGKKQLSVEEANKTRCVTKTRWVVESGSYQIHRATSYIQDHLKEAYYNPNQLIFYVEMPEGFDDLVRTRFQSRHSNSKSYMSTIQFDNNNTNNPIQGWCCSCTVGLRVVGCCSHVCALLWHLGVNRGVITDTTNPLLASNFMALVEDSMTFSDNEDNSDDDNNIKYSLSNDSTDASNDETSDTETED
ncbi:unnamed protein product [Rotaria sp. Silwood2]|nr:unnamed protein product [Rotaria sp. Silwood2]CAF4678810.1 unnamed protein product [Rotaria sp. Silwood2]